MTANPAIDRIVQECAEDHREPRIPGEVAPQVTWPRYSRWRDGLKVADGTGDFDVAVWPSMRHERYETRFVYRWFVTDKATPSPRDYGYAGTEADAMAAAERAYLARTQSQMAAE